MLFSGRPVRAPLILSLLAAAVACIGTIDDATVGEDTPPNAGASPKACFEDDDCVMAGPTCCGCPTFAVTRDDPVARACSNVTGPTCPPPECTENLVARCSEEQRCELACAPRACDQSCAYGFAADMNGCLTCECAVPVPGGCTANSECARTRADCCGCNQGGSDTAVHVANKASYDAMLMCPPSPVCPGINTCTTDVPTCVQGRCALVSADLPVGACGRSDLPRCAAGLECVVNLSDQANMHGVGLCAPPQ